MRPPPSKSCPPGGGCWIRPDDHHRALMTKSRPRATRGLRAQGLLQEPDKREREPVTHTAPAKRPGPGPSRAGAYQAAQATRQATRCKHFLQKRLGFSGIRSGTTSPANQHRAGPATLFKPGRQPVVGERGPWSDASISCEKEWAFLAQAFLAQALPVTLGLPRSKIPGTYQKGRAPRWPGRGGRAAPPHGICWPGCRA